MGRNENDWSSNRPSGKLPLYFKSIELRHFNVEQETAGKARLIFAKVSEWIGPSLDFVPFLSQQERNGGKDSVVVINNPDQRCFSRVIHL